MSNDSVERVCEVCNQEIPKWKSKGTTVCSVKCKFERRERRNEEAREKRKAEGRVNVKRAEGSVLHSCLSNAIDPPRKFCRCKERLTDDAASKLVSDGHAVNFQTRLPEFVASEPLLLTGRKLRAPRSSTVERPHMERLVQRKVKSKDKSIEELQAAVKQDQAERFEEEQLRLEIYNELTVTAQQKWIVQIPAEEYDAKERESYGRPGIFSFDEERTSHGIDIVSLDVPLHDETAEKQETEETEPADVGDEIEKEEQQKEDEQSAEEVLAEYEEIET